MPLYKISIEGEGSERTYDLQPQTPSTYSAEQLKERQDLQALLLNRPDAIDKDLLILREEFDSWQDSKRRIDLLALDKKANLVVIELKIEEEGGHMELQAIRYAAMVSAMDFEMAVQARERFLSRQKKDPDQARQDLLEHLGESESSEVIIGDTPRIVLVAPTFSKEITTTVLWLNARGLDIRCLQARPYRLSSDLYLDVEQIIPLPSAAAYIEQIAEKKRQEDRKPSGDRREPSVKTLFRHGLLKVGTRIQLIHNPQEQVNVTDEKAKWATYKGFSLYPFEWEFDGEVYAVRGLTRTLCDKFGGNYKEPHIKSVDCWTIEGDTLSLRERALQLNQADGAETTENAIP